MATSYNKLWKLLIDRNMLKGELSRRSGVSKATLAKMRSGSSVSVHLLDNICRALGCDYGDIMEHVPDKRDGTATAADEENEGNGPNAM
ncbi:MAG: helix-turn-helix transcriptional regulator [Oscillospiraceae bacterium]|jgi:DNA-binding Xre family transcriptional regulator|nr:helix-turn-helix transcriptional regulator [Oscillospiraceae bacterium]